MPTENQIKRYTVAGLVQSSENPTLQFVTVVDFDRVAAERDALQADRDAKDQRVDELEGLLRLARQFVVNGIDLGYIKMPDVDTPDPAHDLLPKINTALNPTPAAAAARHAPLERSHASE
ncbi:hypothetical protein PUP68_21680 [Pseudomonas chlororaphis]|uniref:hypothetical protein n=1 Tax=Pseudomonas chlororaphis TaxID=587753 RepID=UPI0023682A06|nr:hypothetical protein [Pseudomonas chlororaphis]WDG77313.1 hypothetical protein PUP77_23180 [Pseudomonas chlororaphis]WDG83448.1 hypothetical protein PUP68_21680 [Pseudomonas chlororaphis]